ncbi:unnamed protein product [Enterobius vermicularis]|uniref:Uncharacterized protein n=1 Tax=Enterobius vermicularis TaxID=51028 RepID=A0A0N4V2W6_ENTVE|nr:unnamed protein product [Enterobius vermicularis]
MPDPPEAQCPNTSPEQVLRTQAQRGNIFNEDPTQTILLWITGLCTAEHPSGAQRPREGTDAELPIKALRNHKQGRNHQTSVPSGKTPFANPQIGAAAAERPPAPVKSPCYVHLSVCLS